VIQREGSPARWRYWITGGSAVISHHDEPLAVCRAGSWLPAGRTQVTTTIEAIDDLELLVFGRREYEAACASVPEFARLTARAS
jgi:hypothetical protein